MPKTATFSPKFVTLAGPDGSTMLLCLLPIDTLGNPRGAQFALTVYLDGSKLTGPDGAVVAAPVPAAIMNTSLSGGGGPIQAEIDTLDAAGLLDAYY